MDAFDYHPRTRILQAENALDRLGELVREYGGERVLLVSDPGIEAAGHVEHARKAITAAGAKCFVFAGVGESPTTRHVGEAVEAARENRIDFFVGLGGGSSMDCAKGANFILSGGGEMADYWGVDLATEPMLPMIAVPTTAGTGSEAQSFALIADEKTNVKMACGDKKAACRVALLDPALTLSQPREVAAVTGIDAISHALETYVTTRRNPISQLYSRRSWELLSGNFTRIFEAPDDIEARAAMQLGACLAGMAIETSMLGATHSCANPVTARFGTTHGRAVGIMLPHVIRKNGEAVGSLYEDLTGPASGNGKAPAPPAERLAERVGELLDAGGMPRRLSECGVERAALAEMAEAAGREWTAQFNPCELTEADFLELYECAF